MTIRGLAGPIEWVCSDPIPDLDGQPLLAVVAALHATTRIVICAFVASPRDLVVPRAIAADNVVISAEQLLGALDRYAAIAEKAAAAAPRTPRPPPRRFTQLPLPFVAEPQCAHGDANKPAR